MDRLQVPEGLAGLGAAFVGDVYQLQCRFLYTGGQFAGSFALHYRVEEAPEPPISDSAAIAALGQHITTLWEPIDNFMALGTTFEDIIGTKEGTTDFEARYVVDQGGSGAGGPVPVRAAVVMAKGTGLRGRKNRGRIYIPTLSEHITTASQIDGDALEALQTLGTGLLEISTAAPVTRFALVLRQNAGTAEDPYAYVTVTRLNPRSFLGSQRRRLRRIG